METKNPIQSAERIFNIMEYIATHGPVGVLEIANALNLHKSTVHRMLLSLISMGYVLQDKNTGKYELTFKLIRLSNQFLSKLDVYSIVHPYLERLANICGETVHLVKRVGNEVVYIDKVEPADFNDSSIRMASHIGLMRPMYCSGVGKAILAELPTEEVHRIWEQIKPEKKTKNTITSLSRLEDELKKVKEHGYAIDNEENEVGVFCVAAAIINYQNEAKYAFSVSAPSIRMTNERVKEIAKHVMEIKKELTERFGG